jgi:predicted RNase H-like HicB family nuclease
MDKTIDYYVSLPYTIEMTPEPEGRWCVSVKELPGCNSQGDTPEEAIQKIRDAMSDLHDAGPLRGTPCRCRAC